MNEISNLVKDFEARFDTMNEEERARLLQSINAAVDAERKTLEARLQHAISMQMDCLNKTARLQVMVSAINDKLHACEVEPDGDNAV